MQAPRVPLLRPWSPAGYEVVQLTDERERSGHSGDGPSRGPSAAPGYRVVQVAEEKVPVAYVVQAVPAEPAFSWTEPRPRARPARRPPPREPLPWGPFAALGFFVFAMLIAFASLAAFRSNVSSPREIMVEAPAVVEVAIPEQPVLIDLPEQPAKPPPQDAKEVAADRAWWDLHADDPAPLPKQPAQAAACAQGKCANKDEAETFGTSVAFVRNAGAAARAAGTDGKLVFLLHVSGNFEDSRFT